MPEESKVELSGDSLSLADLVHIVESSDIASIKKTVSEIVNVINDPESSAKQLKDIIELDPPLSAKLLRLANSAFYGYTKRITSIQEAIVCIGFDAVKDLALSQKVSQLFDKYDKIRDYSRDLLWKHSVAVALFCKLLYRREYRELGENSYVAGLLHDLGLIVEDQFIPILFSYILEKSEARGTSLYQSEKEVLGFDHTEIGGAILAGWDLPDELVTAIASHHDPLRVGGDFAKLALSLHVSNYAVQKAGIGYSDMPRIDLPLFDQCRRQLNELAGSKINETALGLILEEVEKSISVMESTGWFSHGR